VETFVTKVYYPKIPSCKWCEIICAVGRMTTEINCQKWRDSFWGTVTEKSLSHTHTHTHNYCSVK